MNCFDNLLIFCVLKEIVSKIIKKKQNSRKRKYIQNLSVEEKFFNNHTTVEEVQKELLSKITFSITIGKHAVLGVAGALVQGNSSKRSFKDLSE